MTLDCSVIRSQSINTLAGVTSGSGFAAVGYGPINPSVVVAGPASFAMLIADFGLTGAAMGRRKQFGPSAIA